ncbi:MAG: DNA-3-methyladenine glycosylase family protein [Chloroflexota bacterium]
MIAPFSFDLPLAYLRGSPATIVERLGERSYHRPLVIDGQPSLLSVSQPADGADTLLVSLQSTQLPNNPENLVRPIVERMFGARTDVRPLLDSIARKDEFGSGLLTRFRGLRPVLFPDLFETIVWAIIGQQINVSFAGKCKRAFVERFGDSFTLDGESWMLFPSPERVLEITEPELAEIQFSRQKSRYILNLAHEVVEGRLDLNALYAMPAETALERLQQLKGVGRWTAEYVLMRGVGQPDVIPAGDGGLRRIIGQQYGMGRLATEHEVRAIAEAWTGWRSYFAFYLWFTLQEEGHARRTARLQQGLANGSPL